MCVRSDESEDEAAALQSEDARGAEVKGRLGEGRRTIPHLGLGYLRRSWRSPSIRSGAERRVGLTPASRTLQRVSNLRLAICRRNALLYPLSYGGRSS